MMSLGSAIQLLRVADDSSVCSSMTGSYRRRAAFAMAIRVGHCAEPLNDETFSESVSASGFFGRQGLASLRRERGWRESHAVLILGKSAHAAVPHSSG